LTDTEKILLDLGEKSFLKLWTYLSPYTSKEKIKKEVCDLLVVFGNHVIIFSDKAIKYKDTGNSQIDWQRWYNKAIEKSANQIYGAENTLKNYQDTIFSDNECTKKLLFPLPNQKDMIIHRIITVPQSKDGAKLKELVGGSGTFVVNPMLKGKEQHLKEPFQIGQINPSKGFIHVLNETSLKILMHELDTFSDFANYLQEKEEFILSGNLFGAYGEEDLLTAYLENEHSFDFDNENILIKEGIWNIHKAEERYFLKKKANSISYFWDGIIEHFTKEMLNKRLVRQSEEKPLAIEIALRFMASESRLERRVLSQAFISRLEIHKDGQILKRVTNTDDTSDKAYIFIVCNQPSDMTYDDYVKRRENELHNYAIALKSKNKCLKDIIGIARESNKISKPTYSLVYLDCTDWDDSYQNDAENLCKDRGYLNPNILTKTYVEEDEYPKKNNNN